MLLKRKTKLSESVIAILEKNRQPLSIQQILQILIADGLTPNKTTLYRMMDKLIESNAVIVVSKSNGVSYYELIKVKTKNLDNNHNHNHNHNHHHHHFFCNDCDLVICLDDCVIEKNKIDLSSLLPNKGFKIQSHDFNIYGSCGTCKKTPKKTLEKTKESIDV